MSQKATADLGAIQREVLEIVNGNLEDTVVGPEDNLLESGVDSLIAAEIVARLEIRFEMDLVEEFFAAPTAADISRTIEAGRARS